MDAVGCDTTVVDVSGMALVVEVVGCDTTVVGA